MSRGDRDICGGRWLQAQASGSGSGAAVRSVPSSDALRSRQLGVSVPGPR